MEELNKTLAETNLFQNERQAQIYTTLLSFGPLGAEILHEKTGLHRETIQREIIKMSTVGTVIITKQGRNKKASAVEISTLKDLIDKEYSTFNTLLRPLLEAEANKNTPKIEIYAGNSKFGMLQTKLVKLQPTNTDIKVISAQPKFWISSMVEAKRLYSFEKIRLEKEVNFHLLCFSKYKGEVEHNNREYFSDQPSNLKRKYRYVETELNSPLQIQVWFGYVIISIFNPGPSIHIVIEDKRIASALKSYHELLWLLAK